MPSNLSMSLSAWCSMLSALTTCVCIACVRRAYDCMELGDGHDWLLLSSPLQRALDTAAGIWPDAFYHKAARLEVWPELREVVTGCDDLGSTPQQLLWKYPHLAEKLRLLPEVWWTLPKSFQEISPDGDALRDAYRSDPDAFEDADEAIFEERLEQLVEKLAAVPERKVVVVAHCDLIGNLTQKLGLKEPKGSRKGWWLRNCECRMLRDFQFA
ncbi:unnamed protein product [Effrenium voratum]|nr:unnamed protein product [Effrenium voratum]